MKRSNSKAKSKDAVLTGERHLELPATSPIIPRKISSGRFIKDFPHLNEWAFVLTALMFNKIQSSHVFFTFFFFFFTAAFHCGGHTLVQKSDIDRARHYLDSLEQVNATGGQREGWAERRTGSDVTIGPEGRGSRSEGAIKDSSEQDTICFKRQNKKYLKNNKVQTSCCCLSS